MPDPRDERKVVAAPVRTLDDVLTEKAEEVVALIEYRDPSLLTAGLRNHLKAEFCEALEWAYKLAKRRYKRT